MVLFSFDFVNLSEERERESTILHYKELPVSFRTSHNFGMNSAYVVSSFGVFRNRINTADEDGYEFNFTR